MKIKTFDCVKMKHDIQQLITQETEGFTTIEKRRFTENAIISDPILERIWKNVRRVHTVHSSNT